MFCRVGVANARHACELLGLAFVTGVAIAGILFAAGVAVVGLFRKLADLELFRFTETLRIAETSGVLLCRARCAAGVFVDGLSSILRLDDRLRFWGWARGVTSRVGAATSRHGEKWFQMPSLRNTCVTVEGMVGAFLWSTSIPL